MRNLRSPAARQRARSHVVRAGAASGDRVRLTVYDLLTGTFYTPRTFFYRTTLDAGALRDSLARTLVHYPLLTGRLERDRDGGLSVRCNDAGAVFTEVDADEPMPDYGLGRSARPELRRYLHEVNPFLVVGRDAPLLTVKVTRMRGGGSVLGVAINHCVVDATSHLAFLRHWSAEHRGLDHPLPCHDRGLLDALGARVEPGARERSEQYAVTRRREKWAFIARVNAGAARMRTLTLRFPAEEVGAIKEAAAAGLAGTGRWVSTSDAFTAHLWKVLAELRARPGESRESLGLIVGVRAALGSALPEHYWGNAVTNSRPALTAAELRSAPLGAVAETVRAAVAGVTEQRVRDEIGFLDAQRAAGRSRRVLSRMSLEAFDSAVALNNVGKLPVYGVEFGGGRPFWYEFPASPVPWTVLITPTPAEDDSRDVRLSLPRDQARVLGEPGWQRRLHAHAYAYADADRPR
ncbi:acyltransferase [Peterkaempfera bronchialis]|nr:acyltransferase [Peterkaempfera bronchialis]